MVIKVEHIVRYLERVSAQIAAHREELTRLDSAIGDADHGTNLHRGFSAVVEEMPKLADKDIGAILKGAGMKLVSTVGGASGPLYGTAFIRAGMVLANRAEIDDDELVAALEAALEGMEARGKAQRGEKTMIDTVAPAIDALKEARARGDELPIAMRAAVAAAEAGMRSTTPMLATKGRASYLGERSIGHQDPGATSAYLMMKVMLEVLES
ncbi:MAG: Phosphoenolpyruvate-dihydroxyacetone phosphotransferase, ADP-binding subunit DhaL [uncultured Chloroflexia bacterium]|uniref:Phosphoenolpyruvate-dihydroxyacetone phosphotransferase, ADP-binding subunit DhaL n=1 Tax=uncultured Chloroflexia bacterium TaxID=1672391 RepID=A0A6J4JNX0_9CHLR|nr:MAG: Phosphoenolpyruvate-dihydroxyacetone phosphotransferase, ADP-binding subunit DhaL [uncultured Chloroflexia bacterium]